MPTTIPIACSLDQAGLSERGAQMATLGQTLTAVQAQGLTARLQFPIDQRAGVEAFVAAESGCCPFFAFGQTTLGEELELTIGAPAGGRMGRARPGRRLRRRLGVNRMSEAAPADRPTQTRWRARLAAPARRLTEPGGC